MKFFLKSLKLKWKFMLRNDTLNDNELLGWTKSSIFFLSMGKPFGFHLGNTKNAIFRSTDKMQCISTTQSRNICFHGMHTSIKLFKMLWSLQCSQSSHSQTGLYLYNCTYFFNLYLFALLDFLFCPVYRNWLWFSAYFNFFIKTRLPFSQ